MSAADEVRRVAEGLTKAQRGAILNCRDEWQTGREVGAPGTTLRSLCFPPLTPDLRMPPSLLSRDYMDGPLRYIYRLTPLGLAVRQHLLANAGEGEEVRGG